MRIQIKLNATDSRSRIAKVRQGIDSAKPKILNDCGSRLVGLARLYFDTLSRGGTSVDGRHWQPPKPSTLKRREILAKRGILRGPVNSIGIQTGLLQQSIVYVVTGDRLRISYEDRPKANYFTHTRPLLPSTLPRQWQKELNTITQNRLDLIEDAGGTKTSQRNYGDHR